MRFLDNRGVYSAGSKNQGNQRRSSQWLALDFWVLRRFHLGRQNGCTRVKQMSLIDINSLPPNIKIRIDLRPGDIGYLTYLHGILYAREYGWDHRFEAYVAGPLAEFAKTQNDRQRIWIVEHEDRIAGSIAIVEATRDTAQLRWFLLHPALRGMGVGKVLIRKAISFCRDNEYSSIILWTVSTLEAAASIYRSMGFELKEEKTGEHWGATVTEQRYELLL